MHELSNFCKDLEFAVIVKIDLWPKGPPYVWAIGGAYLIALYKTGELRKKDKSKTPAENMLIAWNQVGFSVDDPTAVEIAEYQSAHSKLPPEKLSDEAVAQQLMIMELEVATGTYRDQSVASYKEMYSHLGKMMQIMQLERGSPLGDPLENFK